MSDVPKPPRRPRVLLHPSGEPAPPLPDLHEFLATILAPTTPGPSKPLPPNLPSPVSPLKRGWKKPPTG